MLDGSDRREKGKSQAVKIEKNDGFAHKIAALGGVLIAAPAGSGAQRSGHRAISVIWTSRGKGQYDQTRQCDDGQKSPCLVDRTGERCMLDQGANHRFRVGVE